MNLSFATCERNKALGFLQKVCPSKTITDTPESAKLFLDYVEADIVRVQDPYMHGNRIAIIPGNNWDESKRSKILEAAKAFV